MTNDEMVKIATMYYENARVFPEEIIPTTAEELAELIQEICKYLCGETRVDALASETADVWIMMEQFTMLMDDEFPGFIKLVEKEKVKKVDRQYERILEKCEQQKRTCHDTQN